MLSLKLITLWKTVAYLLFVLLIFTFFSDTHSLRMAWMTSIQLLPIFGPRSCNWSDGLSRLLRRSGAGSVATNIWWGRGGTLWTRASMKLISYRHTLRVIWRGRCKGCSPRVVEGALRRSIWPRAGRWLMLGCWWGRRVEDHGPTPPPSSRTVGASGLVDNLDYLEITTRNPRWNHTEKDK